MSQLWSNPPSLCDNHPCSASGLPARLTLQDHHNTTGLSDREPAKQHCTQQSFELQVPILVTILRVNHIH